MSAAAATRESGLGEMLRASFAAMTPQGRRRALGRVRVDPGAARAGFFVFIACVPPAHHKLFGVGLGVMACALRLRHAFGADHMRRPT